MSFIPSASLGAMSKPVSSEETQRREEARREAEQARSTREGPSADAGARVANGDALTANVEVQTQTRRISEIDGKLGDSSLSKLERARLEKERSVLMRPENVELRKRLESAALPTRISDYDRARLNFIAKAESIGIADADAIVREGSLPPGLSDEGRTLLQEPLDQARKAQRELDVAKFNAAEDVASIKVVSAQSILEAAKGEKAHLETAILKGEDPGIKEAEKVTTLPPWIALGQKKEGDGAESAASRRLKELNDSVIPYLSGRVDKEEAALKSAEQLRTVVDPHGRDVTEKEPAAKPLDLGGGGGAAIADAGALKPAKSDVPAAGKQYTIKPDDNLTAMVTKAYAPKNEQETRVLVAMLYRENFKTVGNNPHLVFPGQELDFPPPQAAKRWLEAAADGSLTVDANYRARGEVPETREELTSKVNRGLRSAQLGLAGSSAASTAGF